MSNNNQPNTPTISLEEAVIMTRRYRHNRNQILKPEFAGRDILALNETFNLIDFTNPEVKALRVYFGMSEDLLVRAIVVGVNENNEDMLPTATGASGVSSLSTVENLGETATTDETDEDDIIIVGRDRCPPTCPDVSPINDPNDPPIEPVDPPVEP